MANAPLGAVTEFLQRMADAQAYTASSDSELVKRFLTDKNEKAFITLLKRHGPMVLRVGRHVLGNDHDVEDIFQATFLLLARKAKSIRKHKSMASWLYGVANRLALNLKRREATRQAHERQAADIGKKSQVSDAAWQELQTALHEALTQLPEKYRAAVLLCYLQGKTQEEAAQCLGCPVGTISSRLARGRQQLQKLLQKRGLPPSATALAAAFGAQSASAAVDFSLVRATAKAALEYASGQVATALVSAKAAALVEEGLKAMMTMKLTIALAFAVMIGALGVGAGAVVYLPTTQTPPGKGAPPKESPTPLQAKVMKDLPPLPPIDRFGDPLPPGVLTRLGSQLFRHPDEVGALVFAPDGKAIASGCADGSVRLWDAATGKMRWRLQTHGEQSFSQRRYPALAFNRDSKKLAMLNSGGYVVVDTATAKVLVHYQWPVPKNLQNAISWAIAPDLTAFAIGFIEGIGFEDSIQLHDAATGEKTQRITVGKEAGRPESIAFSSDGKTIFMLGNDVLANKLQSVLVFQSTTGKLLDKLKIDHPIAQPKGMAFSRDFGQLALFGYVPEAILLKPRVVLLDLKSGKPRHVIDVEAGFPSSGAFSPDSKLFALAIGNKGIVLFDTATGKEERRLHSPAPAYSLAFTRDGGTLAVGDEARVITLWNVAKGEVQSPSPEPRGHLVWAKFQPSGKQLITFGDVDGINWWDVAGGQSVRHLQNGQLKPPNAFVRALQGHPLSPDEKIFVTRGDVSELVLLDTVTNQPLKTLKGDKKARVISAVFSPDGTKLFSAGGFDPRIIVWDVGTGKPLMELEHQIVTHVAVSPNARWLASSANPMGVGFKARQVDEGAYDIRLWDLATGKLARRLKPRRGAVFLAVFSADGTRLLTVCGDPDQPDLLKGDTGKLNELQLWDVATGAEVRRFHGYADRVICVAISADGRMIATGKYDSPVGLGGTNDYSLRLWEVATGTERGRIQGHENRVHSVDFSPDGRLLAAISDDAPIYIWDVYALEKSKLPAKVLTKEDKDKLWQQLADEDATMAFQAVRELIARPIDAVAIFQDGWKRVPRATVQQMQKWIEELESNQFAVRQKAQLELDRYLAGHETLLANAIEKANTLEVRQRLGAVHNRLHPETLRRTRMLEVLERSGVGTARQFLQSLAAQTDDAEMSREAKAGLKRLES